MKNKDKILDDEPIDVTAEVNFIWSIANKLRGSYMPDKYGDVIIPMTIIRRFECALEKTRKKVKTAYEKDHNIPEKELKTIAGYQFFNVSEYSLKRLCNEAENIASNFELYLKSFSKNVQEIMKNLEVYNHIKKMNKDGCLYPVVKAFSEIDLHPKTVDSIKMGYIFENLIGRFYQNVDAGQFYTGRDIIKTLVSILISEGCEDIYDDHKIITVCDQACGTGGMLSTAYSYLKHCNKTANIRLFGQEFMGQSYAVGLAEMLIKDQKADNFRHADTFKEDCFKDVKMRFVIENPPFGTPWSGKDAKIGQEEAVIEEYQKGENGRWGIGLPSGGDSQLIFMQSAINKLDPKVGRAAIIQNGAPLFVGSTASGESQIRKWMLENDYIEAIIALPTDLFYNTSIQTYAWIISMNKRKERVGKVQLLDVSKIYHKLRKPAGNKKNELSPEDRKKITDLYKKFEENEYCKIFSNEEFLYKEYTIMQPLQRNYGITEERIQNLINKGYLKNLYDEQKVFELKNSEEILSDKDKKRLKNFDKNKPQYDKIIKTLKNNISKKIYLDVQEFTKEINKIFDKDESKYKKKIIEGLSKMDKKAKIQKDKDGNILYDKETKDIEIIKYNESIDEYMEKEILPHIPDAKYFFEENLNGKNQVIKIGAEIPFTKYFYKYKPPIASEKIKKDIINIDSKINKEISNLLK